MIAAGTSQSASWWREVSRVFAVLFSEPLLLSGGCRSGVGFHVGSLAPRHRHDAGLDTVDVLIPKKVGFGKEAIQSPVSYAFPGG
jgi:hypothetical protein